MGWGRASHGAGRNLWARGRVLATVLAVVLGTGAPAGAVPNDGVADAAVDRLFEEYFEELLALNPSLASTLGDRRYDNRWELTASDRYRESSRRLAEATLDRLHGIDAATLSADRRLSRDHLIYQLEQRLRLLAFPSHLLPLDSMECFPDTFATMGSGRGVHRFESLDDFENFLGRAEDLVRWVDLAIRRMQEGLDRGYVLPRLVTQETITLVARHAVATPAESVFIEPLERLPEDLSRRQRRRLRRRYLTTIDEQILPSYRKLLRYLETDYLPQSRESVSWGDLPAGREWYEALVAYWTSTDRSPEEIHALGLREVARIREQIASLERAEDAGSEAQGSEERYGTVAELIRAYEGLGRTVESNLASLFGDLTAPPLEIAPTHLVSHYRPGTPDGRRPGRFMVSVDRLAEYPRRPSRPLYLHEATPGHHFQFSVQQQARLPRFRRFGWESAYGEGWALYAERLGEELGIYVDSDDVWQRLHSELFRAIRLVVDTGIHRQGWSADDALDYFEAQAGYRPVSEVTRYVALPGQALSYKVGELKILELRMAAQRALGARFELSEFHRIVLESGSLPLQLLEPQVQSWIAAESRGR